MQTTSCGCWLSLLFCLCQSVHDVNIITATRKMRQNGMTNTQNTHSNMELWFAELWEGWALKSDFKLIFTLRWVSESDTVEKFIFV